MLLPGICPPHKQDADFPGRRSSSCSLPVLLKLFWKAWYTCPCICSLQRPKYTRSCTRSASPALKQWLCTCAATSAHYICFAHAIATTTGSNIAWVTHNDAQDIHAPYPGSYGLMALSDGVNLSPSHPSPGLLVRPVFFHHGIKESAVLLLPSVPHLHE